METQEHQQKALENIQRMLTQLLINWNNDDTTSSNRGEERNLNNEPLKTE